MDIKVASWNIRGLSTSDKHKEVRRIIAEEKIQLCAVLETHIKFNKVKKIGEKVFGDWEFVNNAEDNNKGCRIMVGWDQNTLDVWVINRTKQSMLLLVETSCQKTRFFCTIVYASNSGSERRKLWKELRSYKLVTNGTAWVILGDFNVTLDVSEQSNGSSVCSNDMIEFKSCVEEVEIDDLLSSGFHFTWTKSLRNPNCATLKKLDRVMVNEDFLDTFSSAHSVFLPYIISDHSPTVLIIPSGGKKKKSAFRMSNFITEKEEFLQLVRTEWEKDIAGFYMFKVSQKMKLLKHKLHKLSWKNGNVHERVNTLRESIKEAQQEVDKNPFNEDVKKKSCLLLQEYCEAVKDEESLLLQKAKIDWLKDGDRNTKFFHKIIKERQHKSRIMEICDENGKRYDKEQVAEQFLKHFTKFLGTKDNVAEFKCNQVTFPNKLSNEEAERLVKPVSEKEIKEAMYDIDDSKAPGPDGFTSKFFKASWSIVGKDVCFTVQEFFNSGNY